MDDFFQIKICGVKRSEDLPLVQQAGADAVGLNLVPSSPRYVDLDTARRLRDQARELNLRVAIVMMDADTPSMEQAVLAVEPDILQLHGDEMPGDLPDSAEELSIVKSLSWTGRVMEERLAKRWLEEHSHRLAFLVDAYAPGVGGGTGKLARWDLLKPRPRYLSAVPLCCRWSQTRERGRRHPGHALCRRRYGLWRGNIARRQRCQPGKEFRSRGQACV